MSQDTTLPNKVLIVDDDPQVAAAVEEPLGKYGIKVDKATTLETAFYLYNTQRYPVAIIELEFAPLPGLALVQKWRSHEMPDRRLTAFIMISGNKTLSGTNQGLVNELGDLETLSKPFGVPQLLSILQRGVVRQKANVEFHEMKLRVIDHYSKTGDFEKAAVLLKKKVAEIGPRALPILYDLYEKAGKFEEALQVINPLLEKDANNIGLLNAKGRILMRMGRYAEAKTCLVRSDELAPQNIERLNELATAYLHLKEPDNSVKKFKQILELSPEKPELKFEMFSKLYEHGADESALQFGRQVAQPTEIVRHYNNLGVLTSKEGKHQSAIVEYDRALRFYPKFRENFRIYFNIALANAQFNTLEGWQEAVKNLKICLELAPDFEKAKKALETAEKKLVSLQANKTPKQAS